MRRATTSAKSSPQTATASGVNAVATTAMPAVVDSHLSVVTAHDDKDGVHGRARRQ